MTLPAITSGLHLGDCLELMKAIPDGSVDAIFCDPPFGTTVAAFDKIIPFDKLWEQYLRITKETAPIVLHASQPFTSALVMSQPKLFRCEWIWNKEHGANFANARRQPLKQHESILVFAKKPGVYNPQMTLGAKNHRQGNSTTKYTATMNIKTRNADDLSGMKYPKSILNFPKHSSQVGNHPTEKLVSLMRYLQKTYSNPGDLILDSCMGSGTTCVAAIEIGRRYIGIEKDPVYFAIAEKRVAVARYQENDEETAVDDFFSFGKS